MMGGQSTSASSSASKWATSGPPRAIERKTHMGMLSMNSIARTDADAFTRSSASRPQATSLSIKRV
jgi:hypothetical protein